MVHRTTMTFDNYREIIHNPQVLMQSIIIYYITYRLYFQWCRTPHLLQDVGVELAYRICCMIYIKYKFYITCNLRYLASGRKSIYYIGSRMFNTYETHSMHYIKHICKSNYNTNVEEIVIMSIHVRIITYPSCSLLRTYINTTIAPTSIATRDAVMTPASKLELSRGTLLLDVVPATISTTYMSMPTTEYKLLWYACLRAHYSLSCLTSLKYYTCDDMLV